MMLPFTSLNFNSTLAGVMITKQTLLAAPISIQIMIQITVHIHRTIMEIVTKDTAQHSRMAQMQSAI